MFSDMTWYYETHIIIIRLYLYMIMLKGAVFVKNSKLILTIGIIILSLVFIGCSLLNIGLIDKKNEQSQDGIHLEKPQAIETNNGKESPFEDKGEDGYQPSNGAFVLGEYPSPSKSNTIVVWGWQNQADYIIWDWKNRINKKILSSPMDNRFDFQRELAIWLDDVRVLLNGTYLYNIDKDDLRILLPSGVNKLYDYDLDLNKLLSVYMIEIGGKLGVWLVDIDTGYKQEIYSYPDFSKNSLSLEKQRVSFGSNNLIFFDGLNEDIPTILKYNMDNMELDVFMANAKLINVKGNNVNYVHLQEGKQKSESVAGKTIKDEKDILKAAEKYINGLGFSVGNAEGKITLMVDHVFDNTAVVSFGFWASEFIGEIVLNKVNDNWQVAFERQRYYLPYQKSFQDAAEYLASKENYNFADEPGNYIVDAPHWDDDLIILLVGEYGKPWRWEYYLTEKDGQWVIQEKIALEGEIRNETSEGTPIYAVSKFLENLIEKKYEEAYKNLYLSDTYITLEGFKGLVQRKTADYELVDFDLGEGRINNAKGLATVQSWVIAGNEYDIIYYERFKCIKIDDEWRIFWPIDFIQN